MGKGQGFAFEMLEPYEGKLSCTFLRGLGAGNSPWLPDHKITHVKYDNLYRNERRLYARIK